MSEPVYTRDALAAFSPSHDAFVGIDSDGCVFDTMEIKQKDCFHGLIISTWELETIGAQVREAAEFVNLYSRWRGQNRFTALHTMFELLADHPVVLSEAYALPDMTALTQWIASGDPLDNDHLSATATSTQSPDLKRLLEWSLAVNAEIARKVQGIPPFPWAARSLDRIAASADAVCVSQTPVEALVREWRENGILNRVSFIAGQELGTKTEHLQLATTGRYKPGRVIMIGDAAGDRAAAEANNAWFFPINPAHEDASWERFHDEAFDRFLGGTFDAEYQAELNAEFDALLPETPPWST